MKNLNKFLIYRPELPVYLEIDQIYQLFSDRSTLFFAGAVSTRYDLHDTMTYSSICVDASIYIFSNLNLLLDISIHKVSYFKHRYNYTFHDYCATKNKFVKHYEKRK